MGHRATRWTAPLALAAALVAACHSGAAAPLVQGPTVELTAPGRPPARVKVELAQTPQERARGLMFRDRLDTDAGMLFVFERSEVQTFWMKNTYLSLDMLFLEPVASAPGSAGAGRLTVVGVVEEANPLTTTPRSVGRPSRYVLEVLGGWARAHGIAAGTQARLVGVE